MATFQNVLDAVAQCQVMHDNKVAILKTKLKQMAETILQANTRAESLERENRKLWKSLQKKEKKIRKLRKHKEDKLSTIVSSHSRAAITTYVDYADLTETVAEVKLEDRPMEIKELEEDAVVSEMQAQQEAEIEGEAEVEAELPVSEEIEETEEEVEEEAVEEEVEETEEEVEETEEVEDEAAEEEVYMVNIDGKDYYTTNEKSGMIYAVDAEGDVGEEVGYYEDGEPGFYEEE